ncbi:MAG: ABC transporter ATP-binding protein [Dehalococcoidia bacterium]|nr:ABC transporter ATP-binding protein [Dehalococcoidia bacterium]
MLVASNITRDFFTGGINVRALDNINLSVQKGEFLAVIGRSGSGKTTLLNVIAGLDQPTHGTVVINDQDISSFSDRQMTELRRHHIGFVFQSFGLLPLMSAAENIELALRIAGTNKKHRRERTLELLELVGLENRSQHRPYELSGGEQQRVAVARAIANNPPLIIADEPTGELDSNTGQQIFTLLRKVAEAGVTVITATHDPFVIDHVDRVVEMNDGKLLS